MKEIQQWGGGATFSIPSNNNPWLWEVLSINVPPNHSRSAINGDGYIASSHTLYDQKGKIIYQQIVTDAFSGTPCPQTGIEHTSSEERIPSIPVFTRETLVTMTVEQLKKNLQKIRRRLVGEISPAKTGENWRKMAKKHTHRNKIFEEC
jgi:hypothetical protein